MHNTIRIQTRSYVLTLKDLRTSETAEKGVILTKEQLKAAQETGLTVAGIMNAFAVREGYRLVKIGAPVKRTITLKVAPNGNLLVGAESHGTGEA